MEIFDTTSKEVETATKNLTLEVEALEPASEDCVKAKQQLTETMVCVDCVCFYLSSTLFTNVPMLMLYCIVNQKQASSN